MKYYVYDSNLRDRNLLTSTVNTTFGQRRYFSSLDTEIYFGSKQVDEIVAFDFTVSEPKLPIYGFNSYYANRIVSGRRTVQGTFAINFTNTKYILDILNSIDDSVLANDYSAMVFQCPEEDTTGLGIGNSAIFTKRFDITVSYGYGKSSTPTYGGCYQTLVGVQIVDFRQALDTNGDPILDMYSFIAKDIRYETVLGSTPSDPDDGNTTPEDSNAPEIVNENDIEERNRLLSECESNKDKVGFLVNPYIENIGDAYYLCLSIEALNNDTKDFTNVDISVTDASSGANISVGFDSITGTKVFELPGALRESGIKIFNKLSSDPNANISCEVSFRAIIDKTYRTFNFPTFLTIPPQG